MRGIGTFFGVLVGLALLTVAARILGLEDLIRDSIAHGHLLDWVMGGLCTVWLLVILKAPWDLYFEAHRVAFEQQRSDERGIAVTNERRHYVHTVRRRLAVFAVAAHLLSALLIAVVAWATKGQVGYYFAIFFVASTLFRPMIAGYVYLWSRLRVIGEETKYPREDVEAMRYRLLDAENGLKNLRETNEEQQKALVAAQENIDRQLQELRQAQSALGREFEATISRITDNQEVIQGIKSFVRLIAGAATLKN